LEGETAAPLPDARALSRLSNLSAAKALYREICQASSPSPPKGTKWAKRAIECFVSVPSGAFLFI